MDQENFLSRTGLITPRAAAVAGICFSILLVTSHFLIWTSIPANLAGGQATDVMAHSKTISLALNLLPLQVLLFYGSSPWCAIG